MTSVSKGTSCGQIFYDFYWGSGFLPSRYQGVRFRGAGDPVLYLKNPNGISSKLRRGMLDDLAEINAIKQREIGAYNCLMARRLIERGTRYVQLMHAGWDQHNSLTTELYTQCKDTDQPSAALVKDLKQRGLLDDTLVVWGGEFGRTPFIQGQFDNRPRWGRDHHPYAFTVWMAGGGVKPGISHGASDDLGMNAVKDPVHVHDFQATLLHLLGVDHERLTYKFQGRHFRLTDVHGHVVKPILA